MRKFSETRRAMMEQLKKVLPAKLWSRSRSRCSGRTTGIALELIGRALQHPSESFLIRDHDDSPQSNQSLALLVEHKIRDLKLEEIHVRQHPRTRDFHIVYNLEKIA